MFDYSLSNEYIQEIRKKLNLPPTGCQIKLAEPPPELFPEAAFRIGQRLRERFGLETVPPVLTELAEHGHDLLCPANFSRVTVGVATCGRMAGGDKLLDRLQGFTSFKNKTYVAGVGCLGACYGEPLVTVRQPSGRYAIFGRVDQYVYWSAIRTAQGRRPDRSWALLREAETGWLTSFSELVTEQLTGDGFQEFLLPQQRRVTEHCGLIDPESLAEYVACGGYYALARLFNGEETPEHLLDAIDDSGLRGRGGGGYPTGQKLRAVCAQEDDVRYVIANADEGDPGAYMDRALLESDPHRVLEGLMLCARLIGAHQAYIFIRREYPLAVARLRKAIAELKENGLLGTSVLGSGYGLEITPVVSGGAFVCGEETSLLQVMSGHRGTPYPRPPHPAQRGYGDHPTLISNVETFANIPWIALHGAAAYRDCGTEKSPGTKIFCLTGDIKRPGFIEVELGTDAHTVVTAIGGGKGVRALQIGGPSGGILPYENYRLDYEDMTAAGAMVGSGGLVALTGDRCIVDLARHLAEFAAGESCGQCLLCRDGLQTLSLLLLQLTKGEKRATLLDEIESLAQSIRATALCGLGRTAANPVLTALEHFRHDFEEHQRRCCPALSCKELIRIEISMDRCKSSTCLICHTVCPDGAVVLRSSGRLVDDTKCTRCWACVGICPTGSIHPTTGGDDHE